MIVGCEMKLLVANTWLSVVECMMKSLIKYVRLAHSGLCVEITNNLYDWHMVRYVLKLLITNMIDILWNVYKLL